MFRALEVVSTRSSERLPRDVRSSKRPIAVDPEGRGPEYEELLAANEELQSLNEELASSKEEIESINEELTTLNQELSSRNAALSIANELSEATLDTVRSGLIVLDASHLVIGANRSFHRMFHLAPERIEHRRLAEVLPDYFADPRVATWLSSATAGGHQLEAAEFSFDVPSDGRRILAMSARRVVPGSRLLVAVDDMTQLRRIEAELSQSQRMEAIGQLAAGVAHDFNNLLTVIVGGAQLMALELPSESHLRSLVADVDCAARRAAELTHQLLAYAGRGRHFVEFVDLSEIVVQSARLLHSSVPTHVQCRLDLDRDLPRLLADRSQIHQIVDNLLKNALEAAGPEASKSGTVTVRTGREAVARDAVEGIAPGTWLAAGDYVFLEVQDTGIGMTAEQVRRMFDPFFTTKFTGRGLGLAAVQGIVRQHAGTIQVASVPGRGTSIRVLLAAGSLAPPPLAAATPPEPRRGAETIAVVDDEPAVLETIKRSLESYGYRVLPAIGGPEMVALVRAEPSIQAVVLDATMPGMNGLETLKELRALRPGLPVLVCSGLGDSSVETAFAGMGVVAFVNKPFQLHELGLAVAKCFPAGR